jgi:hypothetical protein
MMDMYYDMQRGVLVGIGFIEMARQDRQEGLDDDRFSLGCTV